MWIGCHHTETTISELFILPSLLERIASMLQARDRCNVAKKLQTFWSTRVGRGIGELFGIRMTIRAS